MANNSSSPQVRVRLSAEGVQEVVSALRAVQTQAQATSQATQQQAAASSAAAQANQASAASLANAATGIASTTSGIGAAAGVISTFTGAIGALAVAAAGLVALDKIKDFATAGVQFNASMESAELGIASVIYGLTNISDSQGKQLKGQEAYNGALALAKDLMVQLKKDGLETAATTEQLAQALQAGLGAAIGSGIKDLKKVEQLIVQITQAAGAMGLPMHQLRQEITSILRMQVTNDSVVGKILGLDNKEMKKWKEQGILVDELMKRLEPFGLAAKNAANSFNILQSNAKEAFDTVAGAATTGLFDGLKKALTTSFEGVVDSAGKLSPALEPAIDVVNRISSGIGQVIGDIAGGFIEGVKTVSGWLDKNKTQVDDILYGFGLIYDRVKSLITAIINVVSSEDAATGALSFFEVGWRAVLLAVAYVQDGVRGLTGIVRFVGGAVMDYIVGPLGTAIEYLGKVASAAKMSIGDSLQQTGASIKGGAQLLSDKWNADAKKLLTQKLEVVKAMEEIAKAKEKAAAAGTKPKLSGTGPLPSVTGLRNPEADKEKKKKERADHDNLAAQQKAYADMMMAAAENELKILQASNKLKDDQDKEAYAKGLLTLSQYYDNRRAAIEEEAKLEQDILQKKLAAAEALPTFSDAKLNRNKAEVQRLKDELEKASSDAEKSSITEKLAEAEGKSAFDLAKVYEREKAIAAVRTEMALKQIQIQERLSQNETQRQRESIQLGEQRASLEKRLQELSGNTREAALADLEAEIKKTELLLRKTVESADERTRILGQLRDKGTAQIDFSEASKDGSRAMADLERERKLIQLQVDSGLLYEFQANDKILAIEKERLANMQELSAKMLEAAERTGDKDKIAQAKDYAISLQELAIKTDEWVQSMANLKKTGVDALANGFSTFLSDALSGTKSIGESFRSMAYSVVQSIQQVLSQMLAMQAIKALFSSFGGGGLGGMLGFSTGGLVKAATGGYISGPGTATSDSIPAMLSNGEFVMRAAVVAQPGMLEHLRSLNGGVASSSNFRGLGTVQRFADGGLVTAADTVASGGSSSIKVGLEKGLVLTELQSPEGQRVLVEQIGRNKKAINQITR